MHQTVNKRLRWKLLISYFDAAIIWESLDILKLNKLVEKQWVMKRYAMLSFILDRILAKNFKSFKSCSEARDSYFFVSVVQEKVGIAPTGICVIWRSNDILQGNFWVAILNLWSLEPWIPASDWTNSRRSLRFWINNEVRIIIRVCIRIRMT